MTDKYTNVLSPERVDGTAKLDSHLSDVNFDLFLIGCHKRDRNLNAQAH